MSERLLADTDRLDVECDGAAIQESHDDGFAEAPRMMETRMSNLPRCARGDSVLTMKLAVAECQRVLRFGVRRGV